MDTREIESAETSKGETEDIRPMFESSTVKTVFKDESVTSSVDESAEMQTREMDDSADDDIELELYEEDEYQKAQAKTKESEISVPETKPSDQPELEASKLDEYQRELQIALVRLRDGVAITDRRSTPELVRERIRRLDKSGDPEGALKGWQELLKIYPEDDEAVSEILRIKESKSESDTPREKEIRQPLTAEEEKVAALKLSAVKYEGSGDYETALSVWNDLTDLIPFDPEVTEAKNRLLKKIEASLAPDRDFTWIRTAAFILVGAILLGGSLFLLWHSGEREQKTAVLTESPTPASIPTQTPVPAKTPFTFFQARATPTPKRVRDLVTSDRRRPVTPIPVPPRGCVFIPPGVFQLGAEYFIDRKDDSRAPQFVRINRGFFMSRTEITQAQWLAIMPSNPSFFKGSYRPIERISWFDAIIFCNRLSQSQGLQSCYYTDSSFRVVFRKSHVSDGNRVYWKVNANGYRLPTEAEWEYACRADTMTKYHWGDYWDCSKAMAENDNVADENRCADFYRSHGLQGDMVAPVKSFPANNFGLYDMHGNVQEWCWDVYTEYSSGKTVFRHHGSSEKRVVRGGSWNHVSSRCSCGARNAAEPNYSSSWTGFRIARNIN